MWEKQRLIYSSSWLLEAMSNNKFCTLKCNGYLKGDDIKILISSKNKSE